MNSTGAPSASPIAPPRRHPLAELCSLVLTSTLAVPSRPQQQREQICAMAITFLAWTRDRLHLLLRVKTRCLLWMSPGFSDCAACIVSHTSCSARTYES